MNKEEIITFIDHEIETYEFEAKLRQKEMNEAMKRYDLEEANKYNRWWGDCRQILTELKWIAEKIKENK